MQSGEIEAVLAAPRYRRLGDTEKRGVLLHVIRDVRREASKRAAPLRNVK